MNTTRKTLLLLTLGTICLIFNLGAAQAQTEVAVNYQWTAPASGSAVVHYVVEHSINGGAWTQIATTASNTYTLTATIGESHSIRVAGVDALDRQGVYSPASDPYTPELGAPGQPGKPILF